MNALPGVSSLQARGRIMDIANPTPQDIVWSDIASALSKIARFNGSYDCPAYSVAQHCVMGADALFIETQSHHLAGYFLLHDAHEAVLGDIPRPTVRLLKQRLAAMSESMAQLLQISLDQSKQAIDDAIFAKAGIPSLHDLHEKQVIADMDDRMLRAEVIVLFGADAADELPERKLSAVRFTTSLKPWGAGKAEEAWIDRLQRYLGIKTRIF